MSKEISKDEGLAWEVFLQGLDMTSGELVNEARNECESPLTFGEHAMVSQLYLICFLLKFRVRVIVQ